MSRNIGIERSLRLEIFFGFLSLSSKQSCNRTQVFQFRHIQGIGCRLQKKHLFHHDFITLDWYFSFQKKKKMY